MSDLYVEYKTPDGGLVTLAYDAVYIHDPHGNEIVMWIQDEWEEDPSVAMAIANAVAIALTKGVEEVARIVGRRG